jgi:hypothetical protein
LVAVPKGFPDWPTDLSQYAVEYSMYIRVDITAATGDTTATRYKQDNSRFVT